MSFASTVSLFNYRTDVAQPYLTKTKHDRLSRCFWLNRLTYNSTLEASASYYKYMKRQAELGLKVEAKGLKKPMAYDLLKQVRQA